jgi:GNAT acetyltransferase-like protein
MPVYTLNPLEDLRWEEFGRQHHGFSVFHTTGWLEALRRTYGYEPIVYTTSPPGAKVTNGIVFCRISSWLTGRRLVSLPFADHCEPLLETSEQLDAILESLQSILAREGLKYVEIRPLKAEFPIESKMEESSSFCFHTLDLRLSLPDLFRGFHKDSTQRKIRRAEREGILYESGRSRALLKEFYRLSVLTRRRHKLPPQPIEWFQNLIACLGDRLTIHVASTREQAIATILTLRCGQRLVYKYGCSDAGYHKLGAMPFLFWKAIQQAKEQGLQELDLGRSDSDNLGLITFKGHLGATQSRLIYQRCYAQNRRNATAGVGMKFAKRIIGHLPGNLFTTAGRLLYKHVG